jgi:hypothetical protein
MYTRRELINEANPFKWMAQKQIKTPKPGPVMSQIGSGIKKGLGVAFNNPVTRAASELQKGLIPGAGKTRQQIKGVANKIFSGSRTFGKYGKVGRYYSKLKEQRPEKFKNANNKAPALKSVRAGAAKARAYRLLQNDKQPVKTTINGKTSSNFGLVDSDGNVLVLFYPYYNVPKDNTTGRFINDGQDHTDQDTGFLTWSAESNKFENHSEQLKNTPFVNEPNFVKI